jgi:hypothetical protein
MAKVRWWVPALAVGVPLAAGVVAVGCASAPSGDLVGEGAAAAGRTGDEARAALAGDRAALEAGLERFLGLFREFTPEAVAAAAREAYAADAYFNDGFAELEGAEAIASYFARSAGHTAAIDIEVEDVVWGTSDVYVRWTMRFTTAGSRPRSITAPGMSQLRFDSAGKVIYHRDHWDASGALATFVPLVPKILSSIRSRL